MLENIEILKSVGIDSILKSGEYTMLLLRTFKALFPKEKEPGTCNSCLKRIFERITKLNIMENNKIKERTCVPNWDGLRFVRAIMKGSQMISVHQHINSDFITDEQAEKFIELGVLSKDDFKKLPDSMIKQAGRPKKEKETEEK